MNAKALIYCVLLGRPRLLFADPIELVFLPPDVPIRDVCLRNRSIAEIKETWTKAQWPDDLSLPDIRRDIAALRKENAAKNLEAIQTIITGLAEKDPNYAGKRALLDEIEALRAAGALGDIKNRQLVQKLAQLSTGTSAQVSRALARFPPP